MTFHTFSQQRLMPLPLTVSCFSKIQISLPFWYRLTRVVPEKGPLNGCVCVCDLSAGFSLEQFGDGTAVAEEDRVQSTAQ